MEETSWIAAAKAGDVEAFNHLVLAYQDRVFHQAWWIVKDQEAAEDITQDAFILAFKHLPTFHGGSFRSWLMRIVTNAGIDHLRRVKRQATLPLVPVDDDGEERESFGELADLDANVEDKVERSELAALLQRLLESLPLEYRLLVQMIDVQEMDYAEAARALNIPLGTAKSRLVRARLRLREQLQAAPEFTSLRGVPAASTAMAF